MIATRFEVDAIAEALAGAADAGWYSLTTAEQDGYRAMARVAGDLIADARNEIPDGGLEGFVADAELEAAKRELLVRDSRIAELVGTVAELEASRPDPARLAAELEAAREQGRLDATVPSRQNARTKALRLLVEGRLTVERRETTGTLTGLVVARCKGDSGTIYTLGYDPRNRQWRCSCQELRGQCSHLLALKLITPIG